MALITAPEQRLRAESLPLHAVDLIGDGLRRPATLEDVFVLLTGEKLEE